MKKSILLIALAGSSLLNTSFAEEHHHMHDMSVSDTRISLGLSPAMKQHQLSNMRDHVLAIQTIVGLLAENKFEDASNIARDKLGLTPEMQKMCGNFNNENFNKLGLAFHKSGDELAEALKSKNLQTGLRALQKTMNYCVECHATYCQ